MNTPSLALKPSSSEGGCCNPPKIFLKQGFLSNKLRQTLRCNCFDIFYVSFDVYEMKFGGVVWVWGSSEIMVKAGRLVKSHDFYFVHFINILQDICSKLAI